MAATRGVESAARVLDVLNLLMRADYMTGVAPAAIARELGQTPSAVTRYLATLEDRGCAERVPETGWARPAVRLVQHAASILAGLDAAQRRAAELSARIQRPV